jgi:hypothetical protein
MALETCMIATTPLGVNPREPAAVAGRPCRGVEAVEDGRDAPTCPELLVTAKTQRWKPEELLRTPSRPRSPPGTH